MQIFTEHMVTRDNIVLDNVIFAKSSKIQPTDRLILYCSLSDTELSSVDMRMAEGLYSHLQQCATPPVLSGSFA